MMERVVSCYCDCHFIIILTSKGFLTKVVGKSMGTKTLRSIVTGKSAFI